MSARGIVIHAAILTALNVLAPARYSAAQAPVPVGRGSYASVPPASEGEGPQRMLTQEVFAVSRDRPIPTNDWWTDLLISAYCGDLWAYPFVVSSDAQGVHIGYPREWKSDGGSMELGRRLHIGGHVVPLHNPAETLLADFDGPAFPPGWTAQGEAFGKGPADGRIGGQSPVSGFLGSGLVNSMHDGDQTTGRLVSPVFPIARRYMHFMVGGGNHPGRACVNLLVDGKPTRSETGENSETLRWRTWDLADVRGRNARVEIVDETSGGWGHILADQFILSDQLEPPTGAGNVFAPKDARALRWGDWTLTFRLAQSARQYVDVTLGRGLPYVWLEFTSVEPRLTLDENAALFDRAGRPLQTPAEVNEFGIEQDGAPFGVFITPGSRIERKGNTLAISPGRGPAIAVVVALPNKTSLAAFAPSAFSVPRDSRMEWTYDAVGARVNTRWTLETVRLDGGAPTGLWQGWLPHHLRRTEHALKLQGPAYATPRGALRLAFGTSFDIAFPFRGFAPWLPAPSGPGFDRERMTNYIRKFAERKTYGGDTYWGGKDLALAGQYILMADELGLAGERAKITDYLRRALTDWFTYTPGETEHYFAAYPNWPALVGFNESYWSYQFTDNHFHYGYFTLASALLGASDPSFLAGYGGMARRVASQYAHWDRSDPSFPFLRTFDIWGGHSYAGGFSSPGGNNQESTSEAMQSWAGLFLLGQALDDEGMTAAAAMGYAMESQAIAEYWFDRFGENFPTNYPHSMAGILFDGGQAYATYFSGDPAWVHGIQWLPIGPHLDYLVEDPAWGREELRRTLRERKLKEGDDSVKSMGAALGNVVLGYAALADPDWAITQLDELWNANDPVAHNDDVAGISYYLAAAMQRLGARRWDLHTVPPTGAVYEQNTGTLTAVAWNPRPWPRLVRVFGPAGERGSFVARPSGLTASAKLQPPGEGLRVAAMWPESGATNVSRFLDTFYLVFNQPVDVNAVTGLIARGPGVRGARIIGGTQEVVALAFDGQPQPGAAYEVDAPPGAGIGLDAPFRGRFQLEPQPPLALVSTMPARDADRVDPNLKRIELVFNSRMDQSSRAGAALRGVGAPSLRPAMSPNPQALAFDIGGPLMVDTTYELVIPAARAENGERLAQPLSLPFSTLAGPCPPVIYGDSFAGGGYQTDGTLAVDFRHQDTPFSGRYAMRLDGGEKGGSLYLFRGAKDHGDERRGVDLSSYDRVTFHARGNVSELWIKVGHPVFDGPAAFAQTRITNVGPEYRSFATDLPQARTNIGTLLAISVPANTWLTLDDIRFTRARSAAAPPR